MPWKSHLPIKQSGFNGKSVIFVWSMSIPKALMGEDGLTYIHIRRN